MGIIRILELARFSCSNLNNLNIRTMCSIFRVPVNSRLVGKVSIAILTIRPFNNI